MKLIGGVNNKLVELVVKLSVAEFHHKNLQTELARANEEYSKRKKALPQLEPSLEMLDLRTRAIEAAKAVDAAVSAINVFEVETAKKATVTVASRGAKTAMVIIKLVDESGRKSSLTRHLRQDAKTGAYTGHSLFGHRIVQYELTKVDLAQAA